MKKTLKDFDFKDKKVLLRSDLNVPIKDGKITDDTRIVKSLPTMNYILDQGGSLIVISHLGRPKGSYKKDLSLKPVAHRMSELLNREVKFIEDKDVINERVKGELKNLRPGEIALLENTRFRPEETENEKSFAKDLSEEADIYINDAFGTSHRAHASNVGVSEFLPSAMGLLVEKEVKYLSDSIENPKRPFVVILGGAKVSDKIGVIENLINKVDKILIVGAMAFTFIKAEGYEVGKSLVEEDKLDVALNLLKKAKEKGVKLVLPVDVLAVSEIKEGQKGQMEDIKHIGSDLIGVDIGEKSIENIKKELEGAKMVIWNGPAGVFEIDEFARGTFEIAKTLASLDGALTIIGGGDSASAAEKSGYGDKISHISTGGGASLEMIEGKELPGIKCIEERK
ncbi:phosphoglycerate kinase [Peptoniphilus catoniae]|uniref:phosphoglycerate kinase n=1 Tax=Peptoniphilus catoniae TaxID=1660341 RepID=UPI0010FD663E|nr:phosphoglycerate kinase [Peptoniphilus catoniae]